MASKKRLTIKSRRDNGARWTSIGVRTRSSQLDRERIELTERSGSRNTGSGSARSRSQMKSARDRIHPAQRQQHLLRVIGPSRHNPGINDFNIMHDVCQSRSPTPATAQNGRSLAHAIASQQVEFRN